MKVCFSNMKYPIIIQNRPTQIVKVYFLLIKRFFFNRVLKIIDAQNQ